MAEAGDKRAGNTGRPAGWKHTEESKRKMAEARAARDQGGGDLPPKPKSGAAKRSDRKAADIRLIREGFAELLQLPAMAAAVKGDEWGVDHFTTRGPILAERIATECERNEQLRRWCVKALKAQSVTMLAVEGFMYVVPALMHYGIVPGAEGMGVPVIRGKEPPRRSEPQRPPEQQPHFVQDREPTPEADREAAEDLQEAEEYFEGDGRPINGAVDPLEAELADTAPPPVEAV